MTFLRFKSSATIGGIADAKSEKEVVLANTEIPPCKTCKKRHHFVFYNLSNSFPPPFIAVLLAQQLTSPQSNPTTTTSNTRERLNGNHWDAIEHVVRKLMTYPYPNKFPDLLDLSEDEIVDLFWDKFKAFCKKTAPFDKPARWNSKSAR